MPDSDAPDNYIAGDLDARICAASGCGEILVRRRGPRVEPLCRWIARRYCCRDCAAVDQAARMTAKAATDNDAAWPEITGSTLRGTPFAKHNVAAGDGGRLTILPSPTHVQSASALGGN